MGGQKWCQVKMLKILFWAFSDLFELVEFLKVPVWIYVENDAQF